MSFYQLLFSRKLNGINRNLTWYWNLFAKYMRENVGTLLAKILKIKGNTIVWNQLVNGANGNGASVSTTDNTYVLTSTGVATLFGMAIKSPTSNYKTVSGHKYYFHANVSNVNVSDYNSTVLSGGGISLPKNMPSGGTFEGIVTASSEGTLYFNCFTNTMSVVTDTMTVKNCILVDLTKAGLDYITEPSEFTSLFPLSYYAYDSGSLLSFNGSGIKTTGKNLAFKKLSGRYINNSGLIGTSAKNAVWVAKVIKGNQYSFTKAFGTDTFTFVAFYETEPEYLSVSYNGSRSTSTGTFTAPIDGYVAFRTQVEDDEIMCNVGSTLLDYEPYSSSTKSLPISTYFPDGMLSAGSVYDELTPTSYVKRVGMVDLGSLTYSKSGLGKWFYTPALPYVKNPSVSSVGNVVMSGYESVSYSTLYSDGQGASPKNMVAIATDGAIFICDASAYSSYNASQFKSAMSGVYLYYELNTPLENYGVVDLGSLAWTKDGVANSKYAFISDLADVKTASTNGEVFNATSKKYAGTSNNGTWNNNLGVSRWTTNTAKICIYDPDAQSMSASDFKTSVSGIYLYYEKETPAVIDLDLSYEIEWGGTEQLLPENTSTPTTSPISATVEYPDGEHKDYYTYQEIEKNHLRLNRALSIMLGRNVIIENPQEPLSIIMRGE